MIKTKICILIVLLLGFPFQGFSQPTNIQFDHISVDDGLSHSTITCITQDHLGFMWFGTVNGLCRYDGNNFKIYRNNPSDDNSLSNNEILEICEDKDNNLWIGTRGGGLNLFDQEKEIFISFQHDPNNDARLPHNIIRSIYQDAAGRLWIGTLRGACWYDAELNRFHQLSTELDSNNLGQGTIYSLCEDNSGRLWIAAPGEGLLMVDKARTKLTLFNHNASNSSSLLDNDVMSIIEDNKGKLWIATHLGVSVLDLNSPIMNKEGEIINFIGVKEDITQKKLMIEELVIAKERAEESDLLKSAFLANMSHEIRTPMNGIVGFIDLMQETDLTPDLLSRYTDIIKKSSERLLNTINNIIEISKIESKELPVVYSQVDIRELINNLHDFFSPEAEKRGISLFASKDIPDIEMIIRSDRTKLESILTNFIKNALKFTKQGFVELGYRLDENKIIFHVKDSGLGIPEDKIHVIFDRFVQADLTISKPYEQMKRLLIY